MRRIILLLGIFLLGSSCQHKEDEPLIKVGTGKLVFFSSYIQFYYDGFFQVRGYLDNQFNVLLDMESGASGYLSPDLGSTGAEAVRYKEIAARNGDLSYNRECVFVNCTKLSVADNFSSVRVVCPKGDWDSSHPAGSSLNDLITIKAETYAPFIRGGYTGNEYETPSLINKRLTDLQADDLTMIFPYVYLYFDSHPSSGKYKLEVTLVTTEGQEKTATCTYDFGK